MCIYTILPRCYILLAVTPRPPPPIIRRNYCIGLFYLHYTPPPRGPLEPVCGLQFLHVYACCKCRRVVFVYQACRKKFENWSWPVTVIPDGFLRPSSCRHGRWEESGCETTCYVLQKIATCTWPTTLPSFSTAAACRSKEFSSSTALQSMRIRGSGGGGA